MKTKGKRGREQEKGKADRNVNEAGKSEGR